MKNYEALDIKRMCDEATNIQVSRIRSLANHISGITQRISGNFVTAMVIGDDGHIYLDNIILFVDFRMIVDSVNSIRQFCAEFHTKVAMNYDLFEILPVSKEVSDIICNIDYINTIAALRHELANLFFKASKLSAELHMFPYVNKFINSIEFDLNLIAIVDKVGGVDVDADDNIPSVSMVDMLIFAAEHLFRCLKSDDIRWLLMCGIKTDTTFFPDIEELM